MINRAVLEHAVWAVKDQHQSASTTAEGKPASIRSRERSTTEAPILMVDTRDDDSLTDERAHYKVACKETEQKRYDFI